MAKVVRRCYNSTSECRDNRRKTFEPEGRSENNEKEKKVKVYYIDEDIKGTCFLVQGEQEAILFDPGMAYYGETVVQRVKEILGTQPLRAVFLTHSHYDHVAALPYVRQAWPEIKAYAAEYACHIFEKTKAKQMMFHMSKTAAEESHHEWKSDDYKGELLYADKPLEDGDRIALGERLGRKFNELYDPAVRGVLREIDGGTHAERQNERHGEENDVERIEDVRQDADDVLDVAACAGEEIPRYAGEAAIEDKADEKKEQRAGQAGAQPDKRAHRQVIRAATRRKVPFHVSPPSAS